LSSGKGGIPGFKEGDMGENPCAQGIPGLQTGEDLLPVGVGTTSAVEGAKKANGRKRRCHTPRQYKQKGEAVSPLSPSLVTELPQDFDFIASKTDDEKIDYIQSVLARSEDEAIAVIAPALRLCGTAGAVVEAYLPLILEVKKHICRPGRPRVNPTTGERNKTWEEICNEHFQIGIRRMQQILASLKEPKLSGKADTTSRRPPIDRKDYERARQVAAPARSLAEAVVKQGMGDRFPDALEILKLADIPVLDVQPAANIAEVSNDPDWKGILTELVTTLKQYADRLPIPVIEGLKPIQKLLDEETKPQAVLKSGMDEASQNRNAQPAQFPPTKPMAAAPQDASPLDVANQDAPPPATAPALKQGRGEKVRKPISSPKVTVCPPAFSPEEEERIHERLSASSNRPGRRQGDSVLNEEGRWEYSPEEQQVPEAEEIRNVQHGDLPHSKRLNSSPVASISMDEAA
jgi:hypothetical protein